MKNKKENDYVRKCKSTVKTAPMTIGELVCSIFDGLKPQLSQLGKCEETPSIHDGNQCFKTRQS
jgi:hypothetical protein